MTEATLDIKLWGNSLGVRLPASVARAARLTADQRVRITVEEGRVIITPQAPRPPTRDDGVRSCLLPASFSDHARLRRTWSPDRIRKDRV